MAGAIKLILLEENQKPEFLICHTGTENEFFFSKSYLNGQIKLAKEELIKTSQLFHYNACRGASLSLAPYKYGLTVIDFSNNHVYSMSFFDTPGCHSLDYVLLMKPTLMYELIKQNQAVIYLKKEKQSYLIQEFLGTTDPIEGVEVLRMFDENEATIKKRKQMNGVIQNYAHHSFLGDDNTFILPTSCPFTIKEFETEYAHEFFFTLLDKGIEFSQEDTQNWCDYLEQKNYFQASQLIQDRVEILNEKKQLDKTLEKTISTHYNHKNKL